MQKKLNASVPAVSRVVLAVVLLPGCLLLSGGCVPVLEPDDLLPGDPGAGGDPAAIPEECLVPPTVRVSVDSGGGQATGASRREAISADGRYVAFDSDAPDLVPGDSNGTSDVFVHDRTTGATTRVSVDTAGNQATGASTSPAISADGRWVAFASDAPDLIAVDGNGLRDVFLHDTTTGATTRVSVDSAGIEANGASGGPAISADGRFIAFATDAINLDLILADGNGATDVYVHDRVSGDTERVSFKLDGTQVAADCFAVEINADMAGGVDGRYVVYSIGGEGVFLYDRTAAATEKISVKNDGNDGNGDSEYAGISGDGRYVAFRSSSSDFDLLQPDTNGAADIFLRDRVAGTTERVSLNTSGVEANAYCGEPAISADGRFVGFQSDADNLVPADTNVARDFFLRDLVDGTTERISLDEFGNEGQGDAGPVTLAINEDGRYVAFTSEANDLVDDDTNGTADIFVRARCETPAP